MSGWYVKRNDQKYGPYTSTQLVEMAKKGQVLPVDWVAQGDGEKWMPASQVKGLFAATPQVATTPATLPTAAPSPTPARPAAHVSPQQATQAWNQLPQVLRPVAIAMSLVVGIAVLLSLYGVTLALGDNADVRNQVLIFFSFLHGVIALFAVYQIVKLQRYDLSLLGSVLVMTVWGWYLFATIPLILTFFGIAGGLAVGCWSLSVLRQPEIRSRFRKQTAPWEQHWQRISTPVLSGVLGGGGLGCMVMFGFVLWLTGAKSGPVGDQRDMSESRTMAKSRNLPPTRTMPEPRKMPAPRTMPKSRTGEAADDDDTGSKADDKLKQVRVGMSKQEVTSVLGQPDERLPLGQGEACLYYVSAQEAIFISFDKQGRVFTVHKQDRAK